MNTLWSCRKGCEAVSFLLDNIYIRFGTTLYKQCVGINRASLAAILFLFCYGKDFMMSLFEDKQVEVIEAFSSTFKFTHQKPIHPIWCSRFWIYIMYISFFFSSKIYYKHD